MLVANVPALYCSPGFDLQPFWSWHFGKPFDPSHVSFSFFALTVASRVASTPPAAAALFLILFLSSFLS